MRLLFRLLPRVASGLLTVIPLTLALLFAAVWLTLSGGDMRVAIAGLSAPVRIGLDADGIPRVRARNALDAAAALGFLHARERMFQMDLMRRAMSGQLAELAGPAALPLDRFMRTMGVRAAAESDLASLAPDTRATLDAYARGVNAWIDRRGRFAAIEFVALGRPRPWTALDCLLWGKTMGLYLSGNWRTELARLGLARTMRPEAIAALWPDQGGPGEPAAMLLPDARLPDTRLADVALGLAEAVPGFPAPFTLPATASNAWAVDGTHAVHGAPLLAGDPHLGYGLPGIWYLARIETPEGVLAGATAPGVPMLVLGHNGHIAWSFTSTGADTQDVFVETKAGDGLYATPDGPKPYAWREERIHVRGAPDEVLQVRSTRHGPIISDLIDPSGPLLALSMANLQPGDTAATGLIALNRATTVDEAGRAAAQITEPVQNLMVADHDRIALFVTGRVPIRRAGDGSVPAPGADGSHDWTGYASGEQLPHYVAPLSGRLVNANERVAPPDFPVFLGRDWFDDWRARRIRAMLGPTSHDTADFAAMQADTTSLFAQEALPHLSSVAPDDALSRQALALLRGWDGRMVVDAPQPLIFNAWMRDFATALLARLGVPARAREAAPPWPEIAAHALGAEAAAWCGTDCTRLLASALTQATTELSVPYGPDPATWRWGTAHQAVFGHPLLRMVPLLGRLIEARIEAPGDETTVDRGGLAPDSFDSVHGASFRGVYDLGDLDHALFMIAPGQSGDPASRLSRNFVQRWRDGATIMLGPDNSPPATHMELVPAGATTP